MSRITTSRFMSRLTTFQLTSKKRLLSAAKRSSRGRMFREWVNLPGSPTPRGPLSGSGKLPRWPKISLRSGRVPFGHGPTVPIRLPPPHPVPILGHATGH